jgi:hypothetical protein
MPRQLSVTVDHRTLAVNVPDDMLAEAQPFYAKMDSDMDRGWQMGPEFVEHPDREQRCQIAANKLLTSLSSANETMVTLMAGYILSRLPNVRGVEIDTGGEMFNTRFVYEPSSSAPGQSRSGAGLGKREALARAGKEVSAVYQSGRSYRYAVLDPATGQWAESPAMDDEKEAQAHRMLAFKRRFEELAGNPG